MILPLAALIIFSYVPMSGLVLAFKKYRVGMTIAEAPWVRGSQKSGGELPVSAERDQKLRTALCVPLRTGSYR